TLLTQRVHARVRPIDFVRAASPRTPLALAAPLVGAALIALALDLRLPPSAPTLDAALAGTAASLRGAAERQRARGDVPGSETLEIAARTVESAATRTAAAETSGERASGI